jgi:hypothetical protein
MVYFPSPSTVERPSSSTEPRGSFTPKHCWCVLRRAPVCTLIRWTQYRYDGLQDAEHVLSIASLAQNSDTYLDIDYVVVSHYINATLVPPTGSSSAVVTPSTTTATTPAAPITPAAVRSTLRIPGATAGALGGLLLLGLVLWGMLVRMRRRARVRVNLQDLGMRESRTGRPAALATPAPAVHPLLPSPAIAPLSLVQHPPALVAHLPALTAHLPAPSLVHSQCVRCPPC